MTLFFLGRKKFGIKATCRREDDEAKVGANQCGRGESQESGFKKRPSGTDPRLMTLTKPSDVLPHCLHCPQLREALLKKKRRRIESVAYLRAE